MQLGFLPRLSILQTSAREIGQIYIPAVNWILLGVVLVAVLGFGSSSALASAYGVAMTGTMLVDTFLTFFVIRYGWRYNLALCLLATGLFMTIDLAFFSSSLLKIDDGGWFPLALAGVMLFLMLTWRRGRAILVSRSRDAAIPLDGFLKNTLRHPPQRVPGTAVFMIANPEAVPHALLHNLSHNKVLHERIIFLTVRIEEVPWLGFDERVSVQGLGEGCWRVVMRFGFKNKTDVPHALHALCPSHGLSIEPLETSYFLSRETLVPVTGRDDGMALWRERVFVAMARNAGSAVDYFHLPANRVIELGTRVEI